MDGDNAKISGRLAALELLILQLHTRVAEVHWAALRGGRQQWGWQADPAAYPLKPVGVPTGDQQEVNLQDERRGRPVRSVEVAAKAADPTGHSGLDQEENLQGESWQEPKYEA